MPAPVSDAEWNQSELMYMDRLAREIESTSIKGYDARRVEIARECGLTAMQAEELEMREDFFRALFHRCSVYLMRGIVPSLRSVRKNAERGDLAALKFMLELSGLLVPAGTHEVEREREIDMGGGKKLRVRDLQTLNDAELDALMARAEAARRALPAASDTDTRAEAGERSDEPRALGEGASPSPRPPATT